MQPMIVTQQDIDNYKQGLLWDIDDLVLDYLEQQEYDNTYNLFNCTSFQAINSNNYTVIYHPCSKQQGYQITYFDPNMIAISDIFATTKEELTKKAIDTYNLLNSYKMIEIIQ